MELTLWIAAVVLLLGCVAVVWQVRRAAADDAEVQRVWAELSKLPHPSNSHFETGMVSGLPEPARRFLEFAIQPGTRLSTVVEISMEGQLSLSSREDPKYQAMSARQLLAAPRGFVWRVNAGSGLMRITGSDGMMDDRSWTRFWLLRLIRVVRIGNDPDHLRSSFGRVVAEAAFWSPAFLLPWAGVTWTAVDRNTARVTIARGSLTQSVDIRVEANGQPMWVSMPRWTNANAEKVYRIQPFRGELSDFRLVSGYRIPLRVDGGNFFGTAEYFPFYKAQLVDVHFR
jgi:hypothetical protein